MPRKRKLENRLSLLAFLILRRQRMTAISLKISPIPKKELIKSEAQVVEELINKSKTQTKQGDFSKTDVNSILKELNLKQFEEEKPQVGRPKLASKKDKKRSLLIAGISFVFVVLLLIRFLLH